MSFGGRPGGRTADWFPPQGRPLSSRRWISWGRGGPDTGLSIRVARAEPAPRTPAPRTPLSGHTGHTRAARPPNGRGATCWRRRGARGCVRGRASCGCGRGLCGSAAQHGGDSYRTLSLPGGGIKPRAPLSPREAPSPSPEAPPPRKPGPGSSPVPGGGGPLPHLCSLLTGRRLPVHLRPRSPLPVRTQVIGSSTPHLNSITSTKTPFPNEITSQARRT